MSTIENMKRAIDDFKAKYPNPPQSTHRIHPDDLEALKQEAKPLLTQGEFGRGMLAFGGIALIPDPLAPRLPRLPRMEKRACNAG